MIRAPLLTACWGRRVGWAFTSTRALRSHQVKASQLHWISAPEPDRGKLAVSDRLLLATGSSPAGHRLATSLGHRIVPPVPSLFTFTLKMQALRALAGVSVDSAELSLALEEGETPEANRPPTDYPLGLSGPAVLKLSAYGAVGLHRQRYQGELQVNWLPDQSRPDPHPAAGSRSVRASV
jgi:predicted flavoprotein YhiN